MVFSKFLDGDSSKAIDAAFRFYLEKGKGLPEPSDILEILKAKDVYNGPEYKIFNPNTDKAHPCYADLDGKDQEEIDAQLAKAKKILSDPSKHEQETRAPNYTHWDRHSPEAQEYLRQQLIKSRARMINI